LKFDKGREEAYSLSDPILQKQLFVGVRSRRRVDELLRSVLRSKNLKKSRK